MNRSVALGFGNSASPLNIPQVSRVIRSVKSHEYFHEGRWTPDLALADHFPDAGKVIETCIRYHLSDVELVLKLNSEPSGAFDTHLRLLDHEPRVSFVDRI